MAVDAASIWETIATEAAGESALWDAALVAPKRRDETAVFSPLGDERFALGVESIYEGYLLHYGRARLFAPSDDDAAVLLGDYLYAHGLVRVAELGEAEVVGDLAELLSVCAHLRAEGRAGDGPAWAATVAQLGNERRPLREGEASWVDAAVAAAGRDAVERALSLHAEHTAASP